MIALLFNDNVMNILCIPNVRASRVMCNVEMQSVITQPTGPGNSEGTVMLVSVITCIQ